MSSLILFADNASSTLASGITDVATSLTVNSGDGELFSAPGSGQYALGTLEDSSGNVEVVQITSRTLDAFVIVRAQENTTALAFASGTRFEQRVTAGMLGVFLQKLGGDTLSGTTVVSGVLNLGSGGSIQGGEIAGTAVRSGPGVTANQILVPTGEPATAAGSVILTAANIVANMPAGAGLNISGMVSMWTGLSSDIPTGYVLCDGSNGTPDLRDIFVLGGGGVLPTSGSYPGSTAGASAGTPTIDAHVLAVTELPAHAHPFDVFTDGSGVIPVGNHGSGGGSRYLFTGSGAPTAFAYAGSSTGSGAGHTHTADAMGSHSHSVNSPPYLALFFIMKT